jgi:Skp family chaperone for outer membrane proteins
MNRTFMTMLVVASAALGAVLLFAGKTRSQDAARPASFAFVNIKKAIDGYKKTARLEQEIEKERTERAAKIDAAKKELEEMRALTPRDDMPEYESHSRRVKQKSAAVEKQEADLKAHLQARLLTATKEVYDDIVGACERLRREKGLAALFKVESGSLDSESKAELILRINSRAVLSYTSELDVTDEVLAVLNK